MEQYSRSRRCRRSIRNLRRSSGFFADTCLPVVEVELPETTTNNLESAYGHIWLEQSSSQLVTCEAEKPKHCAGLDVSTARRSSGEDAIFDSLDVGRELTGEGSLCTKDFPSSQQSIIATSHCMDLTSLSIHDATMGNVFLQPCGLKLHSGINLDLCDGPRPQTVTSLASANIDKSLLSDSDKMRHEKSVSALEKMCGQSPTDKNLVDMLKASNNVHEDDYNKENVFLLKENKVSCDVVKNYGSTLEYEYKTMKTSCGTISATKDMSSTLIAEQPIIDNKRMAGDIISLLIKKERRKNERYKEKTMEVKHSESEPKKRKRLSLKKNKLDTTADRKVDVSEKHSNRNTELIPNIEGETEEQMRKEDIQTTNVNYTVCTSDLVDTSQCSENQENYDFVNHMVNNEIFQEMDLKDFHFPDFQTATDETKSKKTLRRSSRYFSLHEMPLNDFSCDQSSEVTSTLSNVPENSTFCLENNVSEVISMSPKVSSRCGQMESLDENKENTSSENVVATVKTWSLEDCNSDLLDNSNVKDVNVMEEVVEDFANLSVNEKASSDCSDSIRLPQKTKRKSSNRRRSGIIDNFDSHQDMSVIDKECKLSIYPHVDCPDGHIPQGALGSQELVSDDTAEHYHSQRSEDSSVINTDNVEDDQTYINTDSSASMKDVDMDELSSHVTLSTEDETQSSVISGYKKSMRIRRSRKSWDMNQNSTSDVKKKSLKREGRKGNSENQPVQSLMPDSAHCSMPPDEMSDQLKDNDKSSEVCKSWNEENEEVVISPGLLSLYKNKNFVRPQPRSWETIKENPKTNQPLFSKQRHKCFLEFEHGITRARLQRRHKKAVEMYKMSGEKPTEVSHEEFGRKMLDVQVFLESL